MVSFFRRKKPETPTSERRYSTEELAAAFPSTSTPAPAADAPAAPARVDAGHVADAPVREADAGQRPAAGLDESAAQALLEASQPHPPMSAPLPPEVVAPIVDARAATAPAGLPIEAAEAVARAAEPVAPTPQPTAPPRPAPPPIPDFSKLEFRTPEQIAADTAATKAVWRERLGGSVFARSLGGLFSRNPRLDDDLLDEIETALITADVGVSATTDLVDSLRRRMKGREFADSRELLLALRSDLIGMLRPVAVPLQIDPATRPFVLLTVGVNGVGKTTTIGKLARRFKDENRTLMLAAGDTFRAAAVAQLQAWGDRNGVPVIAQGQNADAASVAYDALQAAKARGTEVLITDTAGRLHTQQGLMAELGKIKRVIQKLDADAPHEVLLVIDGTTGQNALSQLRQFNAAVGVTGLVVTKLDGTAKGGVVFALAREFGIPIRFAGIGERPEDLRVFDAEAFVDALLPEALGA
ncbi:signal recognition particle-docking protein FtsY [Lysobacter korlensis]|uniref:Signal recognition particle receptor FtsY n=1 Tax=Lysobacter korlensis TaxID=553636 RepID=A0ABV6RPQ6_9GAMM